MTKAFGKPDSIGQYLTIDLTKDILGVSSTGYVVRTGCASDEPAASSRPCALKRIQTMGEEPPDLARLSHENVVQLMHYWTEEKDMFLVMELMDGDLAMLMEEAKGAGASAFSMSVAVDMMLQIAKGMLHLHEMGASHPQLKCENVLYKLPANKSEAFEVGGVVVKLGGFGCSRPADRDSKSRDVLCFGLTCLEILTGDIESSEISGPDIVPDRANVAKSRIPESTPAILRNCIVSCLDTHFSTFSEVVTMLQWAKSYVRQTSKDEMTCSSDSIQTKIEQTRTEGMFADSFLASRQIRHVILRDRHLIYLLPCVNVVRI